MAPLAQPNRLGSVVARLTLAAILLGSVAACGSAEPEGPTPEEQAAMEMQKAEQSAAEAMPAPEPAAPPPPRPPPPVTEESIPEFKYLDQLDAPQQGPSGPQDQLAMTDPRARGMAQPGQVRVAVLYGPGQERSAVGVATVIDTWRKEQLAKALGMPVKVAFLSRHEESQGRENRIRYRPGALKAALKIAEVLPAEQSLEPMSPEEEARAAVDLVIYLGSTVQ